MNNEVIGVFILETEGYVEISYCEFLNRCSTDETYRSKHFIYVTQTSHIKNHPKGQNIGQKLQFNITQPGRYARNQANRQVNGKQNWRAMN